MGGIFSDWHIWALLAAGLAASELLFSGFVLLAFAAACAITAAYCVIAGDASETSQIMLATVSAFVLTPVFVRYYKNNMTKSGAGPLDQGWESGMKVEVTQSGDRAGVVLKGDFYPAKFEDGEKPKAGKKVEVIKLEGITAIVKPAQK